MSEEHVLDIEELQTPITEVEISELAEALRVVPELSDKFRRMAFELSGLREKDKKINRSNVAKEI